MSDIKHRLIMLKPMQMGISGYARLQSARGQTTIQINIRGAKIAAVRAFWYCSDCEVRELGRAAVNPRGEAAITADMPADRMAPERLQAVLIIGDQAEPIPLLIGLCVAQSAGSLLDAKNALLALCDKLSNASKKRKAAEREQAEKLAAVKQKEQEKAIPKPAPKIEKKAVINDPPPVIQPQRQIVIPDYPPREIFLPAIDPFPYITAQELSEPGAMEITMQEEQVESSPPAPILSAEAEINIPSLISRNQPPADRLRKLRWPRAFEQLALYFEKNKPCAIFAMPGWRFVHIGSQSKSGDTGMWIGYWQLDGYVRRVAYAMLGEQPVQDGRPYRTRRGMDGRIYQVLWQKV